MRPRPGPSRKPKTGGRPAIAVPGLAEREAAARAVALALKREATLDEALGQGETPLARAIAVTTFRHLGTILDALGERLAKGLPRDPDVMALLATGAAQILFLDVPDHAAVDLAVRLAQSSDRTRHLSGMVNAVLRRIAREQEEILPPRGPTVELPDWLAARWRSRYGEARLEAIAKALRSTPADPGAPRHYEPIAVRIDVAGTTDHGRTRNPGPTRTPQPQPHPEEEN